MVSFTIRILEWLMMLEHQLPHVLHLLQVFHDTLNKVQFLWLYLRWRIFPFVLPQNWRSFLREWLRYTNWSDRFRIPSSRERPWWVLQIIDELAVTISGLDVNIWTMKLPKSQSENWPVTVLWGPVSCNIVHEIINEGVAHFDGFISWNKFISF